MKTCELEGVNLNWAVAILEMALQEQVKTWVAENINKGDLDGRYNYSTDWLWAGEIIERECIGLTPFGESSSAPKNPDYWAATIWGRDEPTTMEGPTPLIAAMRCYVAHRAGDTVELPELLKGATPCET